MLNRLLVVGLAVLITACVPIPQNPTKTSLPVPLYDSECVVGHEVMLPGQSAIGFASDLPAYIDMIGVSSDLNGETLTATFRLKNIPEKMEFNRKNVENNRVEYQWTVPISIEGDPQLDTIRADYVLEASYAAEKLTPNRPSIMRDPQFALYGVLLKPRNDSNAQNMTLVHLDHKVELLVSHQHNTLTLVSQIPNITHRSTITFFTYDTLLGNDFIPCQINP